MSKASLTLVLPDYALVFANDVNRSLLTESTHRWFKKAQFEPDEAGLHRQLIRLFSAQESTTSSFPVARLRGGSVHSLCADPCYLHADRDKLRLFYRDLSLSMQEAQALCQRVQPLFDELGARLTVQTADNWLLELDKPAEADFHPLEGLHGQVVTDFLPKGRQAEHWIRLWNEVQMMLFDCPENQAREAAGKVPVNSLWFWGQGDLPVLTGWEQVSGELSVLESLASLSRSRYESTVSGFNDIALKPALHVQTFDIEQDWQQQMSHLTEAWLEPAFTALTRWQLDELQIIVPEWGRYRLTPWTHWRFWV